MNFCMIHAFSTALCATAAAQYLPFEHKESILPASTSHLIDIEDHALALAPVETIRKALEERKVPGNAIEKVCRHFASSTGKPMYPSALAQQIFQLAFGVHADPANLLTADERQKYLYLIIDSFCDNNTQAAKSLSAYYLRYSQEFFRSPLN